MTPSLEELRRAILNLEKDNVYDLTNGLISKEVFDEYKLASEAAKNYLALLETHTPEKIEALLKGEAWIAPRKEPKGWTKEDWFHLQVGIDFHEKRDAYVRHYPTNSNLIR